MIIRQIARTQGRGILRVQTQSSRRWVRSYASETERIEPLGNASDHSILQINSTEASSQQHSSQSGLGASSLNHQQSDPEISRIAQRYRLLQHQNETSGKLGAVVGKHYKPHEVLVNPPFPSQLSPELLLASQAHLGHATSLWNPMNSRFIYGVRDGIHIISLEETLAHLRRACRVVKGVTERGGLVLFAGTRKGQQGSVVTAARLAGGFHLFEKWVPGSITNGNQILGGCRKKIVDMHDEEILVSQDSLKTLPALKPDLVVCLNPLENWVLLNECALNNIPTIAVIDTDADPTSVTYPIPANDDSIRCTDVIAGALGRAGQEGQMARKELAARGQVLYDPLELPSNTILAEQYKTQLNEEGVPVEYLDEHGQPMTNEQIAEMQRDGMFVDDSLMTIYNDNDGGEITSEIVHQFDPETGTTRPVLTTYGGGSVDINDLSAAKEPEHLLADVQEPAPSQDTQASPSLDSIEQGLQGISTNVEQLLADAGVDINKAEK